MTAERLDDVALLCNPRAGGRWRVLADVLDSDEARGVHRVVTDDIQDVREAIAGLGKRVKLLCIYGGDGTIYHVINELLRDPAAPQPALALLGGGTMNVTSAWLGMRRNAGESFRQIMRAYRADRLLWREIPALAVTQRGETRYGFTFSMGPLVRLLQKFEGGEKSKLAAVRLGLRSIAGAVSGASGDLRPVLRELEAELTVDGDRLHQDRFAAVFANMTGAINPLIEPFTSERTRETFHFLAYAVSVREFALMVPMLARGKLPIDPRSLLHPVSAWRQALLAITGRSALPADPRYVNHPARELAIDTSEPVMTIDGEVLPSLDRHLEVRLGPSLRLATVKASRVAPVARVAPRG
jgi:diacylglycerol kinase family enzyme